ncbi:MAG: HAD family hydrolase [Gemmatimonadota bacterium]|nr:HAD family hydrolase [Gemmatimonadota bacterium]
MSRDRVAVFLDRDGTLIVDRHYIASPEQVELIPGAAAAIARLNQAGIPVVVISNQSGIGRGLFTLEQFEEVQQQMEDLLEVHGASLDATYICPHAPDERFPCDCRKPGTLLYETASREHELDLTRSTYVGDRWRDIEPGLVFGGRAVLVPAAGTPPEELERATARHLVARSLAAAIEPLLAQR